MSKSPEATKRVLILRIHEIEVINQGALLGGVSFPCR